MPRRDTLPVPMFSGRLGFLSNFDTTPFWMPELDAMVRSGEHAFNALKTTDESARAEVLAQPTPAKAKMVGRRVPLRPGWDAGLRVRAMQSVLLAKFDGADLWDRLQDTGEEVLVETNTWHDNFWGDCRCGRESCSLPGANMLGELLMALRAKPWL